MLLMANQIPNSINGLRKTLKADFITDKEVEVANQDPGVAAIDPSTSKFLLSQSDFSPNST